LIQLADEYGLDIPYDLDRIFIIEELLEIDHEDFESGADGEAGHADFIEAAALPKQYNISFIEVLIRDPLWACVFWEVKGQDREMHEKAPDFGGYCLRVMSLDQGPVDVENSFSVQVGIEDTAWYLGFPPAEGRYQIRLSALRGGEEIVLSVSRPFKLPCLLESPVRCSKGGPIQEQYRNPLTCLSGAKEFTTIRSADRVSRVMGGAAQ
jgi:hypothetical protein